MNTQVFTQPMNTTPKGITEGNRRGHESLKFLVRAKKMKTSLLCLLSTHLYPSRLNILHPSLKIYTQVNYTGLSLIHFYNYFYSKFKGVLNFFSLNKWSST